MASDLSPEKLLTTTRAVRKRLDFSRDVPASILRECLEIAVQAPSGSNRQAWQFVLVSDSRRKQEIARFYGAAWDAWHAETGVSEATDHRDPGSKLIDSGRYLRTRLHEVPWLLIPCRRGRLGKQPSVAEQASFWGSILPAFWSFMLAARSRGLGTAWTTLHLAYEQEIANILSIPFDDYTQVGMSPVAFYKGTEFKPAGRVSVDDVVRWETWDNGGSKA